MKYTKPIVASTNTSTIGDIKPLTECFKYTCPQPFKCGSSVGFSCTFYK